MLSLAGGLGSIAVRERNWRFHRFRFFLICNIINYARNQKIAKQKRLLTTDNRFRKVDDSFVSQGNAVDERYLNEYIQSLFGDDDWCGPDIVDKNEVDLTDDEVILSEIEADLDNSNEKVLERWRESVSFSSGW